MEINLQNKTAWVFGGSKGIGQAIAVELAKAGASVLLIARNLSSLQQVKDELCIKKQQEHDVLSVDIKEPELLLKKLSTYRNLAAVDIVVNNTGGPPAGLAHAAETEEYMSAFKQHVLSAQIATQLAINSMKKKQFGRIINIVSTSVKQPIPGLGVSNTIRGAVANWSKTLASELGPFNITVNNILPGATKTGRLNDLIEKKSVFSGETTEHVTKQMVSEIPIGRFGEPKELAYLVTFLCSNYANYINGINIPVDGGRTKSL